MEPAPDLVQHDSEPEVTSAQGGKVATKVSAGWGAFSLILPAQRRHEEISPAPSLLVESFTRGHSR
jgi:hypothetical protein